MKRTIALLVAFVMLTSFVMPAMAANAEIVRPLASGGASFNAEAVNKALNVEGGTIAFEGIASYETYMGGFNWVVDPEDAGYARNDPLQVEGSKPVMQKHSYSKAQATIEFKEGDTLRFQYQTDCGTKEDGTDYLQLIIDDQEYDELKWYGKTNDWQTVTRDMEAGSHKLTWIYERTSQDTAGTGFAYLDDVEVISSGEPGEPSDPTDPTDPSDPSEPLEPSEPPVELPEASNLDEALNFEGKNLTFVTRDEEEAGYFPWVVDSNCAKSSNQGHNSDLDYPWVSTALPSISSVSTKVTVKDGDICYFRYKVSSEEDMDWLNFYMDNTRKDRWSGEVGWSEYFLTLKAGEYTFRWEYSKDFDAAEGEDTAWLDDVYIGAPPAATDVDVQDALTLSAGRKAQISWNIVPAVADRDVTFQSSDTNVATVDGTGLVRGVKAGTADITITTKDGAHTAVCHVTVDDNMPPVDIYGFTHLVVNEDKTAKFPYSWTKLNDVDPEKAEMLATFPVQEGVADATEKDTVLITGAAQANDVIYGYTSSNYFFTMDVAALKQGKLDVTYKATNITNQNKMYVGEMAYDPTTDTMYAVDYQKTLYTVDLETGNLDLKNGKTLLESGTTTPNLVYGLAIDSDGQAYVMLESTPYNGARLGKLNLTTGTYSNLKDTGAKCFQSQSMCFDPASGRLYWAQFNGWPMPTGQNLYIVDTETGALTDCGMITPYGAELLGMVILSDEEPPIETGDLDQALNTDGGDLHFTTPGQTDEIFPWAVVDDHAESKNQGKGDTEARISTKINAKTGDILRFRYKVSSQQKYDFLRFYVDDVLQAEWSGELDWAWYLSELTPGEHTLEWRYTKNIVQDKGDDTAYLDDVYVGAPTAAAGVTIQKTASVPAAQKFRLTWQVLPGYAWNQEVSFASSDEKIATVDENGVVRGISEGQATITVTTKESGQSDTCTVTVTKKVLPVDLYGFMGIQFGMDPDQGLVFRLAAQWVSFNDVDPELATEIGAMPEYNGGKGVLSSCAALKDGVVYGYTASDDTPAAENLFYSIEFEDLKDGDWNKVQYKAISLTEKTNLYYMSNMSYDAKHNQMYVIVRQFTPPFTIQQLLCKVNLDTGEPDLENAVPIHGEVADTPVGFMATPIAFAINSEGDAFMMLRGLTENSDGGNGCARLTRLNLETGEFTVIAQTKAKADDVQSMCFDPNTGVLYWAQYILRQDASMVQLFKVDTETAALTDCGRISPMGANLSSLLIAPVTECQHTDVTTVNEKEPTCTEPGYTGDLVCAVCNTVLEKGEAIPATGHTWGDWTVTTPASCAEKGEETRTCQVCSEKETREIAALSHDYKDGSCTRCGEKDPSAKMPFTDVAEDSWYYDVVDYVWRNGLMIGVGKNQMAPNAALTRGQLVTVLYRLSGENVNPSSPNPFADVKEDAYYHDAIVWAYVNGIAKGITQTTFSPNAPVTREQAAIFLYRYVTEYLKVEAVEGGDLSVYTDAGEISDDAKEPVAWATAEGIFQGFPDGTLQPQGPLTRAQMAKLLSLLDQKF